MLDPEVIDFVFGAKRVLGKEERNTQPTSQSKASLQADVVFLYSFPNSFFLFFYLLEEKSFRAVGTRGKRHPLSSREYNAFFLMFGESQRASPSFERLSHPSFLFFERARTSQSNDPKATFSSL